MDPNVQDQPMAPAPQEPQAPLYQPPAAPVSAPEDIQQPVYQQPTPPVQPMAPQPTYQQPAQSGYNLDGIQQPTTPYQQPTPPVQPMAPQPTYQQPQQSAQVSNPGTFPTATPQMYDEQPASYSPENIAAQAFSPVAPTPISGIAQPISPISTAGLFAPDSPPMPVKKSKKWLIVGIVVGVVVLLGGGIAAVLLTRKSTNTPGSDAGSSSQTSQSDTSANSIVATTLSDFEKVCSGVTVSNAAAVTSAVPHPIAFFQQSILAADEYTSATITLSDKTWQAESQNPTNTQLVGCFKRASETAANKNCEYNDTSTNKKVSIPLYSVVYDLTVYESKTGKKLGAKQVSGPATSCPSFASYNKSDPKLYGEPDPGSVSQSVKEFVAP